MKLFVVGFVLVVALTLGDAKRCRDSSECAEDECCVRRGIFSLRRGDCQKYGKEGDDCFNDEDDFLDKHEQYIVSCPCEEGLSCEPTEYKNLPFIGTIGINEKCVKDSHTTVEPVPTEEEPSEEPEPETEAPAEE